MIIESIHKPDAGNQQNVLNLEGKLLKHRDVVPLDLATEPVEPKDYKPDTDPTKYHSVKTGRGPLQDGWIVRRRAYLCFFPC